MVHQLIVQPFRHRRPADDLMPAPHGGGQQSHDKGIAALITQIVCLIFLHTKPEGCASAVQDDIGAQPGLGIRVRYVELAYFQHSFTS